MGRCPQNSNRQKGRKTLVTRWGLLSTARINDRIISAARKSYLVEIVAVGSRDRGRAEGYAVRHRIPRAYGSYEELLADPAVEAVYVSLPNHLHVEWVVNALEAGKHVLCEKPLGLNAVDVGFAVRTAKRAGLLLSEAFMWRHSPQTRELERLLAEQKIGRIRSVQASFHFDLRAEWQASCDRQSDGWSMSGGNNADWSDDPRLSVDCGGGCLADVGAYCVNAIRLILGEPRIVRATSSIGPSGVDLNFAGTLLYEDDVLGTFDCGLTKARCELLRIEGDNGSLALRNPFLCRELSIELVTAAESQTIVTDRKDSYQLELENVSEAIRGRADLLLDGNEALAQANVLEALYRAADRRCPMDVANVKSRDEHVGPGMEATTAGIGRRGGS
jgi:D-xylose 1-dehydrogenase (NADP+, D-xylono-1,5-lactone-forming)